MPLHLITLGHKMPTWVASATEEYLRKLPHEFQLRITEIPLIKRTRNLGKKGAIEQEAKRILAKLPARAFVVAMCSQGNHCDNVKFAKLMSHWIVEHPDIVFIIGGPDGLSETCLSRANFRWSLSQLTFPHALVRVILAEQLYRTWSILNGHPYHLAH